MSRTPVMMLAFCLAEMLAACSSADASRRGADSPREHAPVARSSSLEMPEYCEDPPETPLRYPDVEPVFLEHCHRCHTRSYGTNEKAQAIYESTQYPFTTNQPDRLLAGLADQVRTRRGIDEAARCLVLQWLAGGALDADGHRPPYTPL